MISYRHVIPQGTPQTRWLSGVADLAMARSGDTWFLIATSTRGGISSYRVSDPDVPLAMVQGQAFPSSLTYHAQPSVTVLDTGAGTRLLVEGISGAGVAGLSLGGTGGLGAIGQLFPADRIGGRLSASDGMVSAKGRFLISARQDSLTLEVHRIGADNGLSPVSSVTLPKPLGTTDASLDKVMLVTVDGQRLVVAISGLGNFVSTHAIGANGVLGTGAMHVAAEGTGYYIPSDMAALQFGGRSFVVVAGATSSSLSVFRLDRTGALTTTDHVVDELTTRFQSVTALATVVVDGRGYVIAGGADGGISIFTLLPNGRLLHMQTIADTDAMTLARVGAIEALASDGRIVLFVTSDSEAGVTQLSIDPGAIGTTGIVGAGTVTGTARGDVLVATSATTGLHGGAGDDILVTGNANITLAGGTGADTFAITRFDGRVVIADYEPGLDRLDLSMLGMIRSVWQLNFVPQSWGMQIVYGNSILEVRTRSGDGLLPSDFGNGMFPIAHYWLPALDPVPVSPGGQPGTVGTWVFGTEGADTLLGADGADVIQAGGGNDTVSAGAGNDTVQGQAGNDQMRGGDGADRILGQAGNDTLFGDAGNDSLLGDQDNDLLQGGLGNDTLRGGTGNDLLYGAQGADRLHGEGGNDTLSGEDDNDYLEDLEGYNRLIGGRGNDTLVAGAGMDQLWGDDGNDVLRAGAGNDTLQGGLGDDTLMGGSGNDRIEDSGGNDSLQGEDGDDTLAGSIGNDLLRGGNGTDVLSGGDGNDQVYGDAGNDRLYGDIGDDVLDGGYGADFLQGGVGGDRLNGAADNDSLYGGDGNDRITDAWGNNRLYGDNGNDILHAGTGADLLYGGTGNDDLHGGAGNDTLSGDAGNDRLFGQDGNDLLQDSGGDTHLDGGSGHDVLTAGAGRDTMLGGSGDDAMRAGAGNDTLNGGTGNDRLRGDSGDDSIRAGHGQDLIHGGSGNDRLHGQDGNDTLWGEAGNDSLAGDGGNDELRSGDGNDAQWGGAGLDRLWGDGGNDALAGDVGRDTLFGAAGMDMLWGGADADVLIGGLGADVFRFVSISESRGSQVDVIQDFAANEDHLDLRGLGLRYVDDDPFSAARQLRWQHVGTETRITADVNGDGQADFTLRMLGRINLDAGDFFL